MVTSGKPRKARRAAASALTGTVTELEGEMLDLADGREANSRLACQIVARAELDGLILRMPETQH